MAKVPYGHINPYDPHRVERQRSENLARAIAAEAKVARLENEVASLRADVARLESR